jgi:hypothetical protein
MEIVLVVLVIFGGVALLGGLSGWPGDATTSVTAAPPPLPVRPAHDALSETPDDAFVTGYVIGRYVGERGARSGEPQSADPNHDGIYADDWCDEKDWME